MPPSAKAGRSGGAKSTRPAPSPKQVRAAFAKHRSRVWGAAYRMTGVAAEADDIVQETFTRLVERPPRELRKELGPWLMRVAVNLARDHLRRRKRRGQGYEAYWLPEPVEIEPPAVEPEATGGRYDMLESLSYAFIAALETLTPYQRAVLLLRDAYDYSGRETAEALGSTENSVKVALHRARKAMAAYEAHERPESDALDAMTMQVLQKFAAAIQDDDPKALEALLVSDVRACSDGGGRYYAAAKPVVGAAKVALFYSKLAAGQRGMYTATIRRVNGRLAIVTETSNPIPKIAPRVVTFFDVTADGKIAAIYAQLSPDKLARVGPPSAQSNATP